MSLQNVNLSPPRKFFKIETPKRNNKSLQPSERVFYSNANISPIGSGIFDKTQMRESKSVTKFGMTHSKLFLPSITPIRTSISIRDLSDRKSFDLKPSLKKINDEDRQFMRYFQQKFQKSKNVKDALDSSHDSDFFYQKNMSVPDVDLDLLENKSTPQIVRDKKKKNTVGQFTQIHFLDHQKQINKIIQENQMFKVNDSVYTNLIKSQEKVNLLPRKLGVIKQKGLESLIQLNHYSLGDKYAQAFSQSIQSDDIKDKIKKIELMNNGLTDKGIAQILNSLSYTVEHLNLSQNTVGVESANKLIMILRNYQNALSNLNLDNTKLGDQNAIKVLEALKKLHILDLSNNKLTDECSSALANCISTRCPLIELYLHWNRLTGISGERIAKALFDNSNLRVLDLSNNSLGLQNGENCAKAFQVLFAQAESDLIHIDLSNNRWTKNHIQIIQEGINQNKTIYGFHIDSKFSYVDEFGFLNIVQSDQDLINNLVKQENLKQILDHTDSQQKQIMSLSTIQGYATNHQRINGLIPLSYNQNSQSDYISDSVVKQNVCWICQGWSEQIFIWKSGESGMSYEGPIYALFNFNNFKPIPMNKDENGNFVAKIMCPPTKQLQYFFSTPDGDTHAKDQPCIKNKNPFLKDISFGSEVKRDIIIKFLNIKTVNKFEQCLFSKYGEPIHITIQPREEIVYPLEKPKPKKKWSKETSVFGKYQQDNQIILEKAMDADWNNSKIPRFVKDQNDRKKLFELMKPHYEGIKALYKYYSSFSPIGDVWAISKLLFTEIFTKSGLVDNKTLKLADLEIKFISSKTQQKKARSLIPERGMVRHEFLEGIIRIAEEKYMINGDCTSYSEAVTHLLNDGFLKVIAEVENPNLWRDERYWNQECDFCYKYYMQILMSIFENYENTIRTSLPTSKYLNLFEFKKMFTDTSILSDEHANERHINIAFNFSVQTQTDEVYDERILQLHFIEFLEAIARAAEKFSLPPYKKKNVYNDSQRDLEMSWEERQQQPLHKKIENLIRLIFYEALPPEKSDQFELHELSIFDQKEINETTTAPLRIKSNFGSKTSQQQVEGQKPAGLQKVTELLKKTLKLTKQ